MNSPRFLAAWKLATSHIHGLGISGPCKHHVNSPRFLVAWKLETYTSTRDVKTRALTGNSWKISLKLLHISHIHMYVHTHCIPLSLYIYIHIYTHEHLAACCCGEVAALKARRQEEHDEGNDGDHLRPEDHRLVDLHLGTSEKPSHRARTYDISIIGSQHV